MTTSPTTAIKTALFLSAVGTVTTLGVIDKGIREIVGRCLKGYNDKQADEQKLTSRTVKIINNLVGGIGSALATYQITRITGSLNTTMAIGSGAVIYEVYHAASEAAVLCLDAYNSEQTDENKLSDKTVSYSSKAAGVIGGIFAVAGLRALGISVERVMLACISK